MQLLLGLLIGGIVGVIIGVIVGTELIIRTLDTAGHVWKIGRYEG